MPFTVCLRPALRLGLVAFSGAIDADAIVRALRALVLDPRWTRGCVTLWDGRSIRSLDLTPEDVARIAAAVRALEEPRGEGSAAVVVLREVDLLAARLLVERTRGRAPREVRIFDAFGPAAAWLGLSPADTARLVAECDALAASGTEPSEAVEGDDGVRHAA